MLRTTPGRARWGLFVFGCIASAWQALSCMSMLFLQYPEHRKPCTCGLSTKKLQKACQGRKDRVRKNICAGYAMASMKTWQDAKRHSAVSRISQNPQEVLDAARPVVFEEPDGDG